MTYIMWVFVLVVSSYYGTPSTVVDHAEYSSKEACLAAADEIKTHLVGLKNNANIICVAK